MLFVKGTENTGTNTLIFNVITYYIKTQTTLSLVDTKEGKNWLVKSK